jgi:hypothetical protein
MSVFTTSPQNSDELYYGYIPPPLCPTVKDDHDSMYHPTALKKLSKPIKQNRPNPEKSSYLEVVSKTFVPNELHFLDPSIWTKITEHVYHSGALDNSKIPEKHIDKIREIHKKTVKEKIDKHEQVDDQYVTKIDDAIQNAINEIRQKYVKEERCDKIDHLNRLKILEEKIIKNKGDLKKEIQKYKEDHITKMKREKKDIQAIEDAENKIIPCIKDN